MEHYVTLFDSLYLPQGLCLYKSLDQHASRFSLWVLCVDDQTFDVLSRLNLPSMRLLKLSAMETPELLAVKPHRSKGEYCWTLTPFTQKFVFDADATVQRVTYVDADVAFRADPARLIETMTRAGKHVLITEHAYVPDLDQSAISGKFCVQFMTFERELGESVRAWWADRCIEWCYARAENGKFGDQKYLDDWPERFAQEVHVLQQVEWTQAPWNASRFDVRHAVMWHFHGLKTILEPTGRLKACDRGEYALPAAVCELVYRPYEQQMHTAVQELLGAGWMPRAQMAAGWPYVRVKLRRKLRGWKQRMVRLFRTSPTV
jgi:hypothetical protein